MEHLLLVEVDVDVLLRLEPAGQVGSREVLQVAFLGLDLWVRFHPVVVLINYRTRRHDFLNMLIYPQLGEIVRDIFLG